MEEYNLLCLIHLLIVTFSKTPPVYNKPSETNASQQPNQVRPAYPTSNCYPNRATTKKIDVLKKTGDDLQTGTKRMDQIIHKMKTNIGLLENTNAKLDEKVKKLDELIAKYENAEEDFIKVEVKFTLTSMMCVDLTNRDL